MTASNWIAIAGLLLVVVMPLIGLIAHLFTRVSRMEFRLEILWKPVEKVMAEMLHSPHSQHAERDRLLEKLRANALTNGDAERLALLLLPIVNGVEDSSDGKRVAAALITGRLAERSLYRESEAVIPRVLKKIAGTK